MGPLDSRRDVLIRQLQGASLVGEVNNGVDVVVATPGPPGSHFNTDPIAHGLSGPPVGAVGLVVFGGTIQAQMPIECLSAADATEIKFQLHNTSTQTLPASTVAIAWIAWR